MGVSDADTQSASENTDQQLATLHEEGGEYYRAPTRTPTDTSTFKVAKTSEATLVNPQIPRNHDLTNPRPHDPRRAAQRRGRAKQQQQQHQQRQLGDVAAISRRQHKWHYNYDVAVRFGCRPSLSPVSPGYFTRFRCSLPPLRPFTPPLIASS